MGGGEGPVSGGPSVLHVDMDAFFASIEQRDHPRLRGRPVIVGGRPGGRGVVCSPSYEARAFGVRAAMPASRARRLCPDGIFVAPRMAVYGRQSRAVRDLLETFSPDVSMLSLDEARIGIRGLERLHGDPVTLGEAIRAAIRRRFALPASVGISIAGIYAKMACEAAKPDGLRCVEGERLAAFLAPLPVGRAPGVGPRLEARLAALGIHTFRDLEPWSREALVASLGRAGSWIHALGQGRGGSGREMGPAGSGPGGEARPPAHPREGGSRSCEETFPRDRSDRAFLRARLLAFAERLARRLREEGLRGQTVTVKARLADRRTVCRSRTQAEPSDLARDLHEVACRLLDTLPREPLRLLGLGVSGLRAGGEDGALFAEVARDRRLARSADRVRARFGAGAVRPATLCAGGRGEAIPEPVSESRRASGGRATARRA